MKPMARRGVLAAVLTAGLAGTAVAQSESPYPPVPALREERIPPPPGGPRMVWEPGHWHWNGGAYEWVGGQYVHPGRFSRYIHGRWDRGVRGWVWLRAHWE